MMPMPAMFWLSSNHLYSLKGLISVADNGQWYGVEYSTYGLATACYSIKGEYEVQPRAQASTGRERYRSFRHSTPPNKQPSHQESEDRYE